MPKPKTKPLSLRKLNYSPTLNPFMIDAKTSIATRTKRTIGQITQATSLDTGEHFELAQIAQIEEVEQDHFVKIFATGAAAAYELTKPAYKAFLILIREYELHPVQRKGYVDYIDLFIYENQINGKPLNITTQTFYKGIKELIAKRFIEPRTPSTYWVNPILFFKGDRIQLIKEYRRIRRHDQQRDPQTIDFIEGKTDQEIFDQESTK